MHRPAFVLSNELLFVSDPQRFFFLLIAVIERSGWNGNGEKEGEQNYSHDHGKA